MKTDAYRVADSISTGIVETVWGLVQHSPGDSSAILKHIAAALYEESERDRRGFECGIPVMARSAEGESS